ncbi:ribonuclease H family protein [Selenomonas montiformis]|uniref:ribonuclease H family protein n=1 Tax=Selenomonas montiformis TaxID=2652285 RepID=UPI003F893FAB
MKIIELKAGRSKQVNTQRAKEMKEMEACMLIRNKKQYVFGIGRMVAPMVKSSSLKVNYILLGGTKGEILTYFAKTFPKWDVNALYFAANHSQLKGLITFGEEPVAEIHINKIDQILSDVKESMPSRLSVKACFYEGEFCFATNNPTVVVPAVYSHREMPIDDFLESYDPATLYVISSNDNALAFRLDRAKDIDFSKAIILRDWHKCNIMLDLLYDRAGKKFYSIRLLSEVKGKIFNKEGMKKELEKAPLLSNRYELKSYSSLNEVNLDMASRRIIPEYAEESDADTTYIFTDGSANQNCPDVCGWAYVVYQNNQEIAYDKNAHITGGNSKRAVHLAEFLAVLNALDYVIEHRCKKVVICYDNVEVFNMAFVCSAADVKLFHDYTAYVQEKWAIAEHMGISLKFSHVKAHSGIVGNERADRLSKEAVRSTRKYF